MLLSSSTILAGLMVAASSAGSLHGAALSAAEPTSLSDITPIVVPFTASTAEYVVPSGVSKIFINATGGAGGNGNSLKRGGPGGKGGVGADVYGFLPVRAGQVLTIGVGGQGGHYGTNPNGAHGGWGPCPTATVSFAGGSGGVTTHSIEQEEDAGGGGGGASWVDIDGATVIVAGGGGGGGQGSEFPGGDGGAAGDPTHDGYHGGGFTYGNGGHAGVLDKQQGESGETDHGLGAGGGGGGGGAVGGEGGHYSGSNEDGGAGGGAGGTSAYSPELIKATVTSAHSHSDGTVAFSWIP